MTESQTPVPDRRRSERRTEARVAELTLPELRRIAVTSTLFLVVLALFLWMVHTVVVAALLGGVVAAYLRPAHARLRERTGSGAASALLLLTALVVPLVAMIVYGYVELRGVAGYISTHQAEVAREIEQAVDRLPFVSRAEAAGTVRRMVAGVARYGSALPGAAGDAVTGFSVAAAVFLFTAFYVLTQAEAIAAYVRERIPPRYVPLARRLETSARGVLYGAIYSTLLTQGLKSAIILAMNLAFGVPLAVLLALLSFGIGFLPIVGSWVVYLGVAGWLLVFRDQPLQAFLMVAVGFFANTLFISMYLRPRIAAEKSGVLNFYWMFVGLVAGVYTFGIAGILLGPLLVGILKAMTETVATGEGRRVVDERGEPTVPPEGSILTP